MSCRGPIAFTLVGTLAAVLLGCPSTPSPSPEPHCDAVADRLSECGESVPAGFTASCQDELDTAEQCSPECASAVTQCYPTVECSTPAQIDGCVAAARGSEACLCDGDTETSPGTTTTGAEDSTGTTSGEASLCEQSYADLVACGEEPGEGYVGRCEGDLAFGAECHPECETQLEGCYVIDPGCTTLEQVQSCVSTVINFEACLCDDTGASTG